MQMLSDDDVNLRDLSSGELDAAWDLWFDLAQSTNEADPPYTHGVFTGRPSVAASGGRVSEVVVEKTESRAVEGASSIHEPEAHVSGPVRFSDSESP
jgi:hypothetical protein